MFVSSVFRARGDKESRQDIIYDLVNKVEQLPWFLNIQIDARDLVHGVFSDLELRLAGFIGVYTDLLFPTVIDPVFKEVEFQLNTGRLHRHFLIPIEGLNVGLNYFEAFTIEEGVVIRKIDHWEWDWAIKRSAVTPRELWQLDNLPTACMAWTEEVDVQNDSPSIDTRDYEIAFQRWTAILGLIHGQSVSYSWLIRYVPLCQMFADEHMQVVQQLPRRNFPVANHQISDLEDFKSLCDGLNGLDTSCKNIGELAVTRYSDSLSRTNPRDSFIDLWTALEILFNDGVMSDVKRKLCQRIISYMFPSSSEKSTIERDEMYVKVVEWYELRSEILHGCTDSLLSLWDMQRDVRNVTVACIRKFLNETAPYNEIIKTVQKTIDSHNWPSLKRNK